MATERTLRVEKTRKGFPAAWEKGGGATNTGGACVWALADGSAPKAIYVRRKGHLSCGEHALVPLRKGMIRIGASHHRRDFDISVEEVIDLKQNAEGGWIATLVKVADFSEGQWLPELPADLGEAVRAARSKACCYHCREPHFATG